MIEEGSLLSAGLMTGMAAVEAATRRLAEEEKGDTGAQTSLVRADLNR